MKMMRHMLFVAVVAATMLLPSVSADRETGRDLLRGLLQAGIEAVEQKTAPDSEEPEASDTPTHRVAGENSLSQALKTAAEQMIDSVKQRYKEEGRAYARELSDVMVERLMHNPHIRSVISTIQLVGIMVAVYLVLVTISLLVSISRLRRSNREILRLLRKKEKDSDS